MARGKALFGVTCALCHGADLRGGQLNGPNLLRSQLVLGDQAGERSCRSSAAAVPDKGMPPIAMPDEDVKAIAEYIHSMTALSPRQGMPPPSETPVVLNILVGDAAAGRVYFEAKCSSLPFARPAISQGIATRVAGCEGAAEPLGVGRQRRRARRPRRAGRGAAPNAPNPRAVTAVVTLPSGEKVEGRLLRIDDFFVSLTLADGTIRSFTRQGARPRVEVRDPLEPHRALLTVYTDKDMHDVTAFLATLK